MSNDTKILLDSLCVGDILFVESKDKAGIFNSFAQRMLTKLNLKEKFKYTHVILSLGKGLFIESNMDNGVSILTCLDLSEKINIYYIDNYKIFRNKIVSKNKEMKRKIFMSAEYYYGQKYNLLFVVSQTKRNGHAYCSQLVYNIYKDAINLELKSKSFLNDVFPIHIWNILNANNEWYEVTSDLFVVLNNIKEYKKKYHLDFTKNQTFEIINKEIFIEDLNELENIFSLYNILDTHRNFLLFLKVLEFMSSLPYPLNIEIRKTYYDILFDLDSSMARQDIIAKPFTADLRISVKCAEVLLNNRGMPLYCYMWAIDKQIISVAENYSHKLMLFNMSNEEIKVNFRDKTVTEKIIEVDKRIRFSTEFIYSQYSEILNTNSTLCMTLQFLMQLHLLENSTKVKLGIKNAIKELSSILTWDTKLLDEIVNSEHLNACWDECRNESFSSKIEVLIDCRRQILICYSEIMAKIRIMAEYLEVKNIEHSLTLEESIEIYLILDGSCQKDEFIYFIDKLKDKQIKE